MPLHRRFILIPSGSAGDIYPFVWLGRHLADAGHEVLAVVHEPLGRHFTEAGIRTALHGTAEEYETLLHHPDLWHPKRGFALIARNSDRWYRQSVPLIQQAIRHGTTTLVGGGIAFAARIASEAFKVPLVTIQLQPAAFLSLDSPPLLRPGWESFPRSPRWFRKAAFRFMWWQTDWLLAEPLNNYRAELGLPQPVRRVMQSYWNSPHRILALFPEWFCPRAPDWPPQTILTRFPLEDGSHFKPNLPPQTEHFLQNGPPPLVFTPGSANLQAAAFFQAAATTTTQLGSRALFVTPFQNQVPKDLPPSIHWLPSAPFSRLFPRCRLAVHHAGIGTLSQALAAGIPQLLMPLSHDQPDNASRLHRLGVAQSIPPHQFSPENIVPAVRHLTSSKEIAHQCHLLQERIRSQMPPEQVVRLLTDIT